jgi:hypothetical protein
MSLNDVTSLGISDRVPFYLWWVTGRSMENTDLRYNVSHECPIPFDYSFLFCKRRWLFGNTTERISNLLAFLAVFVVPEFSQGVALLSKSPPRRMDMNFFLSSALFLILRMSIGSFISWISLCGASEHLIRCPSLASAWRKVLHVLSVRNARISRTKLYHYKRYLALLGVYYPPFFAIPCG